MKICKVDGCKDKVVAKGYCNSHYKKFRKYGDPIYIHPRFSKTGICSVSGCDRPHRANGLCSMHYKRLLRYGDVNKVKKIYKYTDNCKIESCNNKSCSLGYCVKHYQKFKKYGDPLFTLLNRDLERHGLTKTPEYITWANMKRRCYNPKSTFFYRYGGRGITVCDRWKNSFTSFLSDMGNKPFPKAQIDRIDNDGNYEPGNCRWATPTENARNKSNTKLSIDKAREIREEYSKGNISLKYLAKKYNISQSYIYSIIKNKIWKEYAI